MNEIENILPLFVYGTLMERATLEYVLGRTAISARPYRPIVAEEAVLHNFQVFRGEKGQGWPYIVSRLGAQAPGYLVSGLSANDIFKLDSHESFFDSTTETTRPLFTRERVTVIANGRSIECDVYVPVFENWHNPNWRNMVEADETGQLDLAGRNATPPSVDKRHLSPPTKSY